MKRLTCAFLIFTLLTLSDANVVFKFDGHTHCNVTPEAEVTPTQTIEWHKNLGLTSMAITNHAPAYLTRPLGEVEQIFVSDAVLQTDPSFPIIPGLEWSTMGSHLLIYWPPENYSFIRPLLLDDPKYELFHMNAGCHPFEDVTKIAALVHELGGLVGVAHFSLTVVENTVKDAGCRVPDLDEYFGAGKFDFIEVFNGVAFTPDMVAYNYAAEHGITMISGTDIHTLKEEYAMIPTTIYATDFTAQAIFDAIKRGDTDVQFDIDEAKTSLSYTSIAMIIAGGIFILIVVVWICVACYKRAS